MIKYEDECVGCHTEMGCWGDSCPYLNVPHYYCDDCGNETDNLYEIDDTEQLCSKCIEKFVNDEFACLPLDDKIAALELDVKIIE